MNKDNKNTELDNTDKKLHISDVMKRSLIEEWKNIRNLGCGDRYVHCLTKDERKYNQKRFLEINRILLSEYK
jgi:hypothetical protein